MTVDVRKCACGQRGCSDYWLTGFGKFVQGSGFTEEEATRVAVLLNGEDDLASRVMALAMTGSGMNVPIYSADLMTLVRRP